MVETIISEFFTRMGWTWNLKGGKVVTPSESDVQAALDEAAKQLYNQPVGTQLQVARLIIEKKHTGHDVYMFVGDYL